MPDDREAADLVETVRALTKQVEDLRSTTLARIDRRPVGDVEFAFRAAAKPGTLFMQGQTLSRVTYAALWQWAQDHGAVVTGGYGSGDGSTTFTLPDWRGRVPIGVGTGAGSTVALGQLLGAATVTLTEAQMPSHTHTGSTGSDSHSHNPSNGSMTSAGSHGAHNGGSHELMNGTGNVYTKPSLSNESGGSHTHGFDLDIDSDTHSHTISLTNTGGGGSHENRPPAFGVNYAVWTGRSD